MGKAVVLAGLLALAGCSGTFCMSKAIRLSPETVATLSDQEVQDILTHNEKGAALCGWKV